MVWEGGQFTTIFMDFLGVGFDGLGLLFLLGVLGLGGAGSSVPPASHR